MALPGLLAGCLFRSVEIQDACLSAGIKLHLECVVVLPCDVQASRLPDDSPDSKSFALKAGRIIFRQIPRIRNPRTFGAE
jgi:hypothetical protein